MTLPSPGARITYAGSIEPEADDQALVAASLAGDRQSLDALLRRHYDPIHRLCRRMTGNDADAADATQEALLALVRGLARGRFDGRSRFSTWAHRVAVNACLDELRRRRRRPEPVDADAEVLSSRSLDGRPAAPGVDSGVAERLELDSALQQLPPEFRAAVVLRDVCDLDYAAIAEVLDVPPGTVRSRIARGRAALGDLLRNPAEPSQRPTRSP